ncbi:ATP-binding protein [Clostridium sp. AF37-5]|jgi:Mrp family chromosome partitioning ATPase|uniref:Mrp/NBP35 family ATP-binding protein n=1 Tax=Clostridium sp. AF37-5 TaxID=2293016 RepID=UPI000E4A6DF0|nr:Mrp/NBP35 family ATP-binding protein [Clostridium sp. AF37-5]MBS5670207.1 Mrp/NBP35 family ATP-binding protein [Clostridium sp.]RHO96234.1 ATP-binding protein [Clostridium sp. AF37-5]
MSEECTHDCSTCSSNCGSKDPKSLLVAPHPNSKIGKVIGVVSGKGGVGKSMVTDLLAVEFARRGYHCGILDADITGPSIPKAFGITEKAQGNETTIFPVKSKKYGVDIMSINVLLENESDPVVWRGPVIGGTVRQFWSDTLWDNVDYLFVDMPPGTGDVALTVFQNIPIDGIVVVTSPQDLVSMIVGKAMKMASLMNIPVLGLVENMSYALCPDCGKKIHVFGESHISEIAEEYHVPVLAQMPINPSLASACDNGTVEDLDCSYLEDAALVIERGQR